MKHIVLVNTPHGTLMSYVRDTEDEARALRERVSTLGIWGKEAAFQLYKAELVDEINITQA